MSLTNKKAIIVLAVIIISISVILASTTIFHILGEDYGTGLNLDTTTETFEHYGIHAADGEKIIYSSVGEIMNREAYITSWNPDELSQTITVNPATFYVKTYGGETWTGFFPIIILGQYTWTVQYIPPNKPEPRNWITIIDGRDNYINHDYVSIVSGDIIGNLPNMEYHTEGYWGDIDENWWGSNTWASYTPSPYESPKWMEFTIPGLSFQIKGQKIGGIRVFPVLEFAEAYYAAVLIPPVSYNSMSALISQDYAYLAGGTGRVDVMGIGAAESRGTEYTPETNRPYTVYVFEEGSTVVFSVDADYSGGQGWQLALYRPDQGNPVQTWNIPNNVRGYEVTYTIPPGAYNPQSSNRWKIVLKNTIIDQSETEIFIIDTFEKAPGITTVQTDKYQYNQGETVTVTLTAQANPNGTGEIYRFYTWAKYDSPSGTNYAYGPYYIPAYHQTGYTYIAQYTFTPTFGDRFIYIRAFAQDSQNRTGYNGNTTIYIKQVQGNYKITIITKDPTGTPIPRVKITISDTTTYTNNTGQTTYYLPRGTYRLTAEKPGYQTHTTTITVNANTAIEITMQTTWLPPGANWIIVLIILVIIAMIVYVGVTIYKKRK